MLQDKELRLVTLGRLVLLGSQGDVDPTLSTRRRKLALLAVLAMARRPMSRDQLVEMFWGGQTDERARHSLSSALSHLRRVLGRDVITLGTSEVELRTGGGRLTVDVFLMEEAIRSGDDTSAIALYQGPFLDGVHVDGSNSFEDWVTAERLRLEAVFCAACERQCQSLAKAKDWPSCARIAARWLDAAPLSSNAALFRLHSLIAPNTREAYQRALAEYERLRVRLDRDFGQRPDKAVAALAKQMTDKVALAGVTQEFVVPEAMVTPPASATAPTNAPREESVASPETGLRSNVSPVRHARRRLAAIGIGIAAVIGLPLLAWSAAMRNRERPAADGVPVVAIVDIGFAGNDTATAWIADGMPQLLASKLSRSRDLEIVAPSRMRDVRVRAELTARGALAGKLARELAAHVGATWAVTGMVTDADTVLRLNLTVTDVRTGTAVRVIALDAPNVLALADAAAARLLDAAGASGGGPQLGDVETSSAPAYEHYLRFLQARHGGGREALAALDSAIALDSGFVSALRARIDYARSANDHVMLQQLDDALVQSAHRATDWDRLSMAATEAFMSGDWPRATATARALVERFPRDPRSYQQLATVAASQGQWEDAERAALAQLALDSLAVRIGRGPCTPCYAYHALALFRMGGTGDFAGAERLLRRLTELQGDAAMAWSALAQSMASQGRYDEAIVAERRALRLSETPEVHHAQVVRYLILSRRFDAADSALRTLAGDSVMLRRGWHGELSAKLARERGVHVDTDAGMPLRREDPGAVQRDLANHRHAPFGNEGLGFRSPDLKSYRAVAARAFAWQHALLADRVGMYADTAYLRVLADSIQQIGAESHTGRERLLHHHVRGILAMRNGQWADAEQHFAQVVNFSAWSWTRSTVLLATVQLEQGKAPQAIATLRRAYASPFDAQVYYVPRRVLHELMTAAFAQAGQQDSARLYRSYLQ